MIVGAVVMFAGWVLVEALPQAAVGGQWIELLFGVGLILFLFGGIVPIWMTWAVKTKTPAARQRYEESREPGFVIFRALMLIRDW